MQKFKISQEYIQLNQLLKAIGWSSNGAEANAFIDDGLIKVNGETETRRRNKIRAGDKIVFKNSTIEVE